MDKNKLKKPKPIFCHSCKRIPPAKGTETDTNWYFCSKCPPETTTWFCNNIAKCATTECPNCHGHSYQPKKSKIVSGMNYEECSSCEEEFQRQELQDHKKICGKENRKMVPCPIMSCRINDDLYNYENLDDHLRSSHPDLVSQKSWKFDGVCKVLKYHTIFLDVHGKHFISQISFSKKRVYIRTLVNGFEEDAKKFNVCVKFYAENGKTWKMEDLVYPINSKKEHNPEVCIVQPLEKLNKDWAVNPNDAKIKMTIEILCWDNNGNVRNSGKY